MRVQRMLPIAFMLCIGTLFVVLNGCGDSSTDPVVENWIVTVSPNSFTVAAGESFEVEVRAEYTSGSSGDVDLSLVEPSPSGAAFDPTVATMSGECYSGDQSPPTVQASSGEGFCTVVIHITPIAPPGDYEIVIRGKFNNTTSGEEALDDSNPIFVTVGQPPAGWHVVQEVSANFVDLDCPSSSVCYAVGEYDFSEVIYRTTDGGRS